MKNLVIVSISFTIFICMLIPTDACFSGEIFLHSQVGTPVSITVFDDFQKRSSLFHVREKTDVYTEKVPQKSLVLLTLNGTYSYPAIIVENTVPVRIDDKTQPPVFKKNSANEYFYDRLHGRVKADPRFPFADLLIDAKKLLDSSSRIKTLAELSEKKIAFEQFISLHYNDLQRTDLIQRFVAQYFMMHEYVDYHQEGAPPEQIQKRYQSEVFAGVNRWLDILSSHIPEHVILNYCVSLYYNRSMVTLASKIVERFRELAYCPGETKMASQFPGDLNLIGVGSNMGIRLRDIDGNKVLAFVSDDCPVSMVEAVAAARHLSHDRDTTLLVMPIQQLNEHHMSIQRMVSGGKILFVDDEVWRRENLSLQLKLPMFVEISEKHIGKSER